MMEVPQRQVEYDYLLNVRMFSLQISLVHDSPEASVAL